MRDRLRWLWCWGAVLAAGAAGAFEPPGLARLTGPAGAGLPNSQARITFASKDFDFGRIPQGEVVNVEFVFTNTGSATLEVMEVRPGCGCTTLTNWDRVVAPGKTGRIPLVFNSRNFSGPVSKPATVTCNDPTSPSVVLQIKGEIWRPIDVQPNFVYFGSIDPETNETRVARIINNTDQPLTITELQSTNAMFRAELEEKVAGREFELRVSTVPPLTGVNPQTLITAKLSSVEAPELRVAAMAMVQEPVVAVPRTVMLPGVASKTASQYMVSIRNNRPAVPLAIKSAQVNLTNVTVRVTEAQPGVVYNVLLGFPPEFRLEPGAVGQLVVETTHPKGPRLSVNIVQLTPRPALRPPGAAAQPVPITPPLLARPGTNAQGLR